MKKEKKRAHFFALKLYLQLLPELGSVRRSLRGENARMGLLSVVVVVVAAAAAVVAVVVVALRLRVGAVGPREIIRLRVEFHRFLMALSVRPGRRLAISAHLLPNSS